MNSTSFELTIQFDSPVTVFVLQMGGWAPPPLASASNLFIDRNIAADLKVMQTTPAHAALDPQRTWLNALNSPGLHLSPAVAAAEGSARRFPTFAEFLDEVESISASIAACLPSAAQATFSREGLQSVYAMFADRWSKATSEQAFLLSAAPVVADRVAKRDLPRVERQVLDIASELRLKRTSMPVVAVLSCLYEDNGTSALQIGRRVIKPRHGFNGLDAHNALSDIHALEFLATADVAANGSAGLCTRDLGLTGLWVGLRIERGDPVARPYSVRSTPQPILFPRLPPNELPHLIRRLQE